MALELERQESLEVVAQVREVDHLATLKHLSHGGVAPGQTEFKVGLTNQDDGQ